MRAGGRPKNLKSGVRWVSTAHSGGKRKAKKEHKPAQEINPDIAYDSDGDGKADLFGWILYGPNPQISEKFMWIATIILLIIIYIKYS